MEKDITAFSFIDFLSMDELVYCDKEAFKYENKMLLRYDEKIKEIKNELVFKNFESRIYPDVRLILCDDLGIDKNVWLKKGYIYIKCEYYFNPPKESFLHEIKTTFKKMPVIKNIVKKKNRMKEEEVYVGYWNDRKYVFIGKMNRVSYRLLIDFRKSNEEAQKLFEGKFENKKICTYLTSLHEAYRVMVPDLPDYEVYQIQDGYLPPMYSCSYHFKPNNHTYYAWDVMGEKVFKSQNIPVMIMPFRKKIYLPEPKGVEKIKTILIVASGAGDWTAMKNRSDEDRMVQAFIAVAKKFPDITFIYRCHPVWVHPSHQGSNSILRVAECFEKSELNNIKLSANIPQINEQSFTVTYPRSSLEEDLKTADIVFGDHSVSMIDAAMEGTYFSSVDVMSRQNLFLSMTELGFPHCESVEDICDLITALPTVVFRKNFVQAVNNYNKMTDLEE